MSRANPYTQRQIQRAIRAAVAEGFEVTGVTPEGTVLTGEKKVPAGTSRLTAPPKPRDAREKLGV